MEFESLSHLQDWKDSFKSCHGVWDHVEAKIRPECLPIISIVPSVIAAAILCCYCLRPLLSKRPLWLRVFASESDEKHHTPEPIRSSPWTVSLTIISAIALCLSIVAAILPPWNPADLVLAFPWVSATLVLVLFRLKTTPGLLFILYAVVLAHQFIRLTSSSELPGHTRGLSIAEACVTVGAIVVILAMPMREPHMRTLGISKPFKTPTFYLRSPEDNLSLWQFMSVSWMSPLISVGYSRQLHDEDVWKLPFDFQHERLHLMFRELRGSVVKRLLEANSIDLIITCFLGLVELVAKFASPVLLQQLLRSIENDAAPKKAAVAYAVIILALRFVAAQSGVFSLWYCRRCYERSRGEMITMIYEKTLSRKVVGFQDEKSNPDETDAAGTSKDASKAKESASMGKILNLMRNDVYEVAQRFWEFQNILTKPLSLVFSVVLIWQVLGWPCLVGALTVILAQFINIYIVRALLRWERIRRAATDIKLQKTTQFIEAIRHLRWYDWQNPWLEKIMTARQKELRLRVITGLWSMGIGFTNQLASNLFPVTAFWAFTMLAGQPLRVDIAFPALQLFNLLAASLQEVPNLITVLLSATVAVGRIEDFMNEPDKDELCPGMRSSESSIEFFDAGFAWPGAPTTVLNNINLKFEAGLNLICGKVGQGKTALLQAILGELDKRHGEVIVPDEMIGYCAQTPWLQSMSIRENILFSAPYEERRYKQVLDACALIPDLANFKHGDLSNLGENGVGLSGGQRARVALARAIYSHARILLLDDPLAALDHDTAEQIVRRAFRGPLMENRTVILVTHRLELCKNLAQQIVDVQDGGARVLDATELEFEALALERTFSEQDMDPDEMEEQHAAAVPDKFIEEEHRAHGGVVMSVYWQYVKAGKLRWWAVLIVFFALFRLGRVAMYWFLKDWGEAYGEKEKVSTSRFLDDLPAPDADVKPWLLVYLMLGLFQSFFFLLSEIGLLIIIYQAGRRMFNEIMLGVAHATFRFYDVTPVGRLMNRLTSDISVLDGKISNQLQTTAWYAISWATSVIVIASITPLYLILTIILVACFVYIFLRFLPTSQSLRRLEMVSLSPLMSNFGALLEGLTTVRAFHAQPHFQARVIAVVDAFQKMDHFYWSLQAWLMFRFDMLSAACSFTMAVVALYTNLSSGMTAFMLVTASNLVNATHSLCRNYGQLQMDFVSVERVVELLDLEPEPKGTVAPPAAWPTSSDDIVFDNVTIKYAPHLDPSLKQISFRIPAGRTTVIIGRTGSGKSTLILSLLATVRPAPDNDGSIHIGAVSLSTVDIHALRQRVTFVAQDPVLFAGTLRSNLDPLSVHSDEDCASILARVLGSGFSLDTHVEGGGRNLSQGQRQLVGLGRAILRRSAIVLLDEATASIDRETAASMLRVLRDELRGSTVVTVAHRAEAVKEADWVVALEGGQVVDQGPPGEVLNRGRAKASGNSDEVVDGEEE